MCEMANDAIRYHREVEEARADAYFDRCFYSMPGAWFGCIPVPGLNGGITVDPGRLLPALAHLRKHRHYRVTATRVQLNPNPDAPGIRLDLEWVD